MSDLISKQAVLMRLADYQLQESPNWGANGMGNADAYEAITECIRVIEQAPTIDPVRHGKWIPVNERAAKCSLCGEWEYTNGKDKTGTAIIHRAIKHYCSNCGARMDGVEKIGHWVDHVKDFWCSECGGRIQKEQAKMFSICPYCNARMDGEE